jgi:hypothetical protein
MSAEQLDAQERSAFLDWRRELARLEEDEKLVGWLCWLAVLGGWLAGWLAAGDSGGWRGACGWWSCWLALLVLLVRLLLAGDAGW